MDKYGGFEQLQEYEQEGIDFRLCARIGTSGIAILCIHGGDIEPGTSEIADGIAGNDHTFYALEGLKTSGNRILHITSTVFDEPIALQIAAQSEIIISIHGCSETDELVYLGGLDQELRGRIQRGLHEAGFRARDNADADLCGMERRNICNLCGRGMGVQLEISRGLRSRLFCNLTAEGRNRPTECFFQFVKAVRDAIEPYRIPAEEWIELLGSDVFS